MNRQRVLHILTGALFLSGCAGSADKNGELRAYIEEVKARPAGAIEELPSFRPFEPFIYSSAGIRSPFDLPIDVQQRQFVRSDKDIKPDFSREKEFLESFDLGALSMVGSLEQRGTLWALIKDASGGIHRVSTGNFVGKNHGKIVEADTAKIKVVEIVSDGLDGWVERPRIIALSEKD